MARKPMNHGEPWSEDDVSILRRMAKTRPIGIIADTLGRTEAAVQAKAAEMEISLMPPERSPYGRPDRHK